MTIDTKSERMRGFKEGLQQFDVLRAKWPKAFPSKSHEVRPLASGAKQTLVEVFGWSPPYARAVLMVWKLRPAYCQAILQYRERINLDGLITDEEIDDKARAMAKERLERIAVRRAQNSKKLCATAEGNAPPEAPDPTPAATSVEEAETVAPAELPKSGKLLVAGSAAMEAALKRRLANGPLTTEIVKIVSAPLSRTSSARRPQR